MKMIRNSSLVKKFLSDQSGQVLIWFVLGFLSLIAVAGLVIDGGQAYADHAILQNSANAAALAAAGAVYNTGSTTNASTYGNDYSGTSGDNNATTNIPGSSNVSTTITPVCLNMLLGSGTTCAQTGNVANAVHAYQTNTLNTFFMKFFGVKTMTIKAEATATMQGIAQRWNVAIVLDATPSMASKDPYCTDSSDTAEQCAMSGIQTMLGSLTPCAGGTGCTAGSSNSTFRVSMFSFPNITTAYVGYDTTCTGSSAAGTINAEQVYSLPAIPVAGQNKPYTPFAYTGGYSGTTGFTPTYQVTPGDSVGGTDPDSNGFYSDYYSASGTNHLNSSSKLVKLIGNGSTAGCMSVPATNYNIEFGNTGAGYGVTYFASAIYAAQTALMAEKSLVDSLITSGPKSQNAIIFVSDGQANTSSGVYPTGIPCPNNSRYASPCSNPATSAWATAVGAGGLLNLNGTGNYPDSTQDCQQGIMASQAAQALGTRFYSVAYGSETSGCVTDTSVISGIKSASLNVPITSASQVIPCLVMEDMASANTADSDWYFYTDGSSAANGCTDNSHFSTDLQSIFGAIAATFTTPRLIPNTAT